MKTVRLSENKVVEIIPEYALPVAKWYGEAFAAQCIEAPNEVEQNWAYDPETNTFSEPTNEPEPEPEPEPTLEDRVTGLEETTTQQGEILNILLSGDTGETTETGEAAV